jgi:hypothetical protein
MKVRYFFPSTRTATSLLNNYPHLNDAIFRIQSISANKSQQTVKSKKNKTFSGFKKGIFYLNQKIPEGVLHSV